MEFEFDGKKYIVDPNKEYPSPIFIRSKGFTPLMYIISVINPTNCDKFAEFVNTNKDQLNIQNNLGCTALMLACSNDELINQEQIIEILINAGSDLNLQDINGSTALIFASHKMNQNITSRLLNTKDINLNIKNQYNDTAIMYLVNNIIIGDTEKLNIIQLFLNKGADINIREKDSEYDILCCICMSKNNNFKENAIKLLLDTDINLKTVNNKNKSGFEYICEHASEETIKDCFIKHIYYNETILKLCIKITPHKQVVLDVLDKLYSSKINCFNAY